MIPHMARAHHEPESVLRYRRRVGRGKIMRPKTFSEIVRKTMERYGFSRPRAEKVAGKAYWRAAEARARRARHAASR